MKPTILAVVGPTAIGKTAFAIALAGHYGSPVISADSRQFFREMQIGTAAPTHHEQEQARHFFVHHLSIYNAYDAGAYERDALDLAGKMMRKYGVAILCGGSGLYVDAVLKGLHSFPEVPEGIRHRWERKYRENGLNSLQEELKEMDPIYYSRVDLQNPQRLIRALSVTEAGGKSYSSYLQQSLPDRPFRYLYLQLEAPREVVYQRIEKRVDQMMEKGLIEEAWRLYPYRDLNALQTVGYQELFAHFDGKCTLKEAVAEIKKNTRRFAKRQLTWYRSADPTLHIPFDQDFAVSIRKIETELCRS